MIQVTGSLKSPLNEPIQTSIRVTSLNSEVSIMSAVATEETDANGNYSFSLVNGIFRVDVFIDDEYSKGEEVEVTNATASNISLSTLLTTYKYIEGVV